MKNDSCESVEPPADSVHGDHLAWNISFLHLPAVRHPRRPIFRCITLIEYAMPIGQQDDIQSHSLNCISGDGRDRRYRNYSGLSPELYISSFRGFQTLVAGIGMIA